MDNNELLSQVLAAMQEQTEVLTRMMDSKIEASENRTAGLIQEAETRIKVMIENDVTKRLDALTDGYKLNHEKQYELERRMEALERRLERLEIAG